MRISEGRSVGTTSSPRGARSRTAPDGIGFGSCRAHHGEILQGVFEHEGGLVRGLVTLPCDLYGSYAVFEPSPLPVLTVTPSDRVKAFRAASEALAALGRSYAGGHLYIQSETPLSRGFGSSTGDVIATVRATFDSFGRVADCETTAGLAVTSESASDSLMFGEDAVLFAQRSGFVIEGFSAPIPPLGVLGFGTSRDGAGVPTLEMRPAVYDAGEIAAFAELRALLRRAVETQDAAAVGAVAGESARINQRHLPVPGYTGLEALAARTGSVGLQVAHSGDIAGMLFDATDPDVGHLMDEAEAGLADLGVTKSWRFAVGGSEKDPS
ncbi:GHMP family kinase ATP-binding protein [Nocardiopsis lambiniae]|uniref:GHMP kinase n=1 Tax=Nocardiopsis lambiniae TaxID=3075539 RepID=A0ABU2M646_9ACTN|nr:GHMP kinase [Nocardiopsis sp. DSM 44743]MDT0328090.1 GHMP kinase [Nocardiopsis sp. DSM 44743]